MAVISLRPDLDQNIDALPLYVAGLLPGGKPLLAYEGRLQIKNPYGPCTVVQIGGDALPPGASISVDSDTMEVVVAWPAYSEHVTPLANPGFETGDTSGWSFTPRGGGGVPVADSVYRYEGAHSLRWPGGKGLGSEGGIEVEVWNNTIGPCLPGQRVTSHARCMYNPAGHNFGNRYQGLLRFLDGAGVPIGNVVRGKLFKGRGNNGRWNDASATGIGPVGTKAVQMGAWLTGSNAPVWLDAVSWNVPSSVGVNVDSTFNLTLRVRDSAGRTALWNGQITVKTGGDYASYTSYFAPDGQADGYAGDITDFCAANNGGKQIWQRNGNAVVRHDDPDFEPNGYCSFDGVGDYYYADTTPSGGIYGWPSDPASGLLSECVWELSVKTMQPGERVLMDGYVSVEGYYQLNMRNDGRIGLYEYSNGYLISSVTNIRDGNYHEIRIARTNAGVYTIEVDGVLEATATYATLRLRYNTPAVGAQVSSRNAAYDFAGKIGYARAWVNIL